jgi:hypothetical protein
LKVELQRVMQLRQFDPLDSHYKFKKVDNMVGKGGDRIFFA